MTGMEAGWYRDPAPPNPAFPTTLRYWDGSGWTTEVKAASRREREEWHRELAEVRAAEAARSWEQAVRSGAVTAEQVAQVETATQRLVTPDGQALSGWWRRVGALLIDGVLIWVLGMAVGWPWVSRMMAAYREYVAQVMQNASTGAPMPDATTFTQSILGSLLAAALVIWLVQLLYVVGFLKAFNATPGKMALGLEVRLRERPGPLPWGAVLARWGAQYGVALIGAIPLVGLFASLYLLLDPLWPLWDGRRQALHDKAARTNVVRRAR